MMVQKKLGLLEALESHAIKTPDFLPF